MIRIYLNGKAILVYRLEVEYKIDKFYLVGYESKPDMMVRHNLAFDKNEQHLKNIIKATVKDGFLICE